MRALRISVHGAFMAPLAMETILGKTYAIADLHGRHDLLVEAINLVEKHSPDGGKVVFMGDYVDRGPTSRQVVETLMEGPRSSGWEWVCLQGNHEEIMIAGCLGNYNWWIPNGGGATLLSYGGKLGGLASEAAAMVPPAHLAWMCSLPLYHEDDHRVFVHAGVDETLELAETPGRVLQWHRYECHYPHGYRGKHVVHGHEQYEDGPILHAGRSDFDTMAWLTGRLAIGVFDDATPGGPVEVLEVVGAPFAQLAESTRPAGDGGK